MRQVISPFLRSKQDILCIYFVVRMGRLWRSNLNVRHRYERAVTLHALDKHHLQLEGMPLPTCVTSSNNVGTNTPLGRVI